MVIEAAAASLGSTLLVKGLEKASEKISENIVAELWKKVIDLKWKHGTDDNKEDLKNFLENDFSDYFDTSVKRHLQIRTLNNQQNDVYLDEIYHPLVISSNNEKITIDDSFSYENERITNVIGVAGQGKSTILKKIFMQNLYNTKKSNKIPLFFDLRDIQDKSILENIRETIPYNNDRDNAYSKIEKLLSSGRIMLILDGFDEVKNENRKKLLQDIINTNQKYKTQIITSSRPETEICLTQGITNYNVCHLTEEDVRMMVKKMVNPETYPHLMNALDINTQLLNTITTPILVILFCICERHLDSLPKDAREFYNRIFNILYEGHDKTKNFYDRYKNTKLEINEARDIFCCFCFISIFQNKFNFNEVEMEGIAIKALKNNKVTSNQRMAKGFCDDIINITGLIRKDGYLNNTFIHKTIQEFHAAEFIRMSSSKKKTDINKMIVEDLSKSLLWLNTASYLFAIDKDNSIDEIIIPLCIQLRLNEWRENESDVLDSFYLNQLGRANAILEEKKYVSRREEKKVKKSNKEDAETKTIMHGLRIGPFSERHIPLIVLSGTDIKIDSFNKSVMDRVIKERLSIMALSSLEIKLENEGLSKKNSISIIELIKVSKIEEQVKNSFRIIIEEMYKKIYLKYKCDDTYNIDESIQDNEFLEKILN